MVFWIWLVVPALAATVVQVATERWHAALVSGAVVSVLVTTLALNDVRPDSSSTGVIAAYAYAVVLHLPLIAVSILACRAIRPARRQ
jgi:ABC-type glycerol-3-phosphate transport system permease component